MAFSTRAGLTTFPISGGEEVKDCLVAEYKNFQDGLYIGRFCKYNSAEDKVENIDGTSNPIIAGVVRRDLTGPVENGEVLGENNLKAMVMEAGLMTVEVVAGITPNKFDKVYVYNNTDVATSEWGKATTHATDKDSGDNDVPNVAVDGYFWEKVDENVWIIRIK